MKKIIYSIGILAIALFIAIPAITNGAPDQDKDRGRPIVEAIEKNKDARNQVLASASSSTTTNPAKNKGQENKSDKAPENKAVKADDKDMRKSGISTTTSFGKNLTKNLAKVKKDFYDAQKAHLIAQLNKAIKNLEQIRNRIVARMQAAEASGRNMTNAKSALVIADAKIVAAKNAISAFAGVSVTTSVVTSTTTATTTIASSTNTSTTSTSTVIVDLAKPRQAGATAIDAIKAAKKALVDVVIAIAHSMGLKVGQDGTISTSTPTTTPSNGTGTTTATTTATTTNNSNTGTTTATTTAGTNTGTTTATTTTNTSGTTTATTTAGTGSGTTTATSSVTTTI